MSGPDPVSRYHLQWAWRFAITTLVALNPVYVAVEAPFGWYVIRAFIAGVAAVGMVYCFREALKSDPQLGHPLLKKAFGVNA